MSKFAEHRPQHPLVAELLPTTKPALIAGSPVKEARYNSDDDGSPECDCEPTGHKSTCFTHTLDDVSDEAREAQAEYSDRWYR